MSRKKQIAVSVLASRPASMLWRSIPSKSLRILAYHRILDDDPSTYEFDEGVISATSRAFRDQMQFVRDNFDVVTFKVLHDLDRAAKPWPKRPLIVTFDDGYLDNYTVAFPLLKEVGIPAIIYLAAAHMESEELFWWDKIAYCIKHAQTNKLIYPQFSESPLDLTCNNRSSAIAVILQWIKTVHESVKSDFLAKLPTLTNCPPRNFSRMHLCWDEVVEMSSCGIEFGSHTLTHPILPNVEPHVVERELVGSKRLIEDKIGMPVVSFSYPVGRYTEQIASAVRKAGYSFAVSYTEAAIRTDSLDRLLLPRLHVEPQVTFPQFRSTVMFPEILLSGSAIVRR
jgi:peptidoglycan/xylan/chitin deacetylase (PgdA/CDA1 family)